MGWEVRPRRYRNGWRFSWQGKSVFRVIEADAWAELNRLRGEDEGRPAPLAITALCDRFLDYHPSAYAKGNLARFVDKYGDLLLDGLPKTLLRDYHKWLKRQRCKRRVKWKGEWKIVESDRFLSVESIRKHVSAASSVLGFGHDMAWVLDSYGRPMRIPLPPGLETPGPNPRPLSPDQLREVFASLNTPYTKHVLPLVRFILETGCRPSEARRLEWDEVDLAHTCCVLPKHKTAQRTKARKPRIIPLTPTALVILEEQKQRRHGRWVFTSRLHKPYTKDGLGSIFIRRGFEVYRLRHTWCQAAADSGMSEGQIIDIMGHETSRMAKHYCDLYRAKRQAAATTLDGLSRVDIGERPRQPAWSGKKGRKTTRTSASKTPRRQAKSGRGRGASTSAGASRRGKAAG